MINVPPDWGYTVEGACALNIYNNNRIQQSE
jgi:hypothetical protein